MRPSYVSPSQPIPLSYQRNFAWVLTVYVDGCLTMLAFPKAGFVVQLPALRHTAVIAHQQCNKLITSTQVLIVRNVKQLARFSNFERQNLKLKHALAWLRVRRRRDWTRAARRHAPVGASFTNRVAGQSGRAGSSWSAHSCGHRGGDLHAPTVTKSIGTSNDHYANFICRSFA